MIVVLYRLPGGRLSLENEPRATPVAATIEEGLWIRRKAKGQARVIAGTCDMTLEAAVEAGLLRLRSDSIIPAPAHGFSSTNLRAADAAVNSAIAVRCPRCVAFTNASREPKVGWCPRCERFQFLHEAIQAALPDAAHLLCVACGDSTWCEHFLVCDAIACAQRRHSHPIGDCENESLSRPNELRSCGK